MDPRSAPPDAAGPLRVLIDGAGADVVPIWDRGLAYGDGLFETVLIRDGAPCQWSRHLARLTLGCTRLGIPAPPVGPLEDEVRDLLQGIDTGVLKVLITRGTGGRGYRPAADPQPRRALLLYPLPTWPDTWCTAGVNLRFCLTRASQNRTLAGIKHLNRLDSVLARAEWTDPEIAEGLMLREDGQVIGGTMTNLFLWTGTALLTPVLDLAGIAGTVRALTLEIASRQGLDCRERDLPPRALREAPGLFVTNSLIGVWPVRRLDGRDYDLGRLPWSLLKAVAAAARTTEWP
ncbi:aminodeoxychorismate lyase [uncultured Thiodictyon sp.]|uniref:aminodeoxychorismate lyase n=1 Tax=uncultured Thiodictyon sp. TaxID=1846217 RepID=UPI0025CB99E3|nr:aminodeoxychorismate lyase [uncultured Thiodictyon sp.]